MNGFLRRLGGVVLGAVMLTSVTAGIMTTGSSAEAAELPPGGTFVDDNESLHQGSIEAIAAAGITMGCNPPHNDRYCPKRSVSRAEMASFLSRALDLPEASEAPFSDIAGSVHAAAIDAVSAAGITVGCNPPDNDRFCPSELITRAQMATMLARAFDLTESADTEFTDIGGSVHAGSINAIALEGITRGCNPPDNDRFCPMNLVTREQMASFLARSLGIDAVEPPPAPFHLISTFTTHHPCCQSRIAYVQQVADKINGIVLLPGDEFSMLSVLGNRVQSGNCQTTTTLFNAIWYAGLDEIEHRPHSVDYSRYPQAIEATLIPGAVDMRFSNDTAHPLEIRASYTGTSVTVELWGDNDGRSTAGDFHRTTGTVIDIVSEGGPDARIVETETIEDGRSYTVTRTVTDSAGTESETWNWTYRY